MNLRTRSELGEIMDDAGVSFEEFRACLRELETINRWTLAYGPTLRWLTALAVTLPTDATLWDIGSGGGDMLRRIVRRIRHDGTLDLVGIDINPWAKQAADGWLPEDAAIRHETCDIFSIDPSCKATIIVSSLFTHHLNDAQLVAFLAWMEQHAVVGWFINDLHRHWLPYHFIKRATELLSSNRLIRHDAAVSVARAFTRRDWERLLAAANIPRSQVQIRWHFPFRYCVARLR